MSPLVSHSEVSLLWCVAPPPPIPPLLPPHPLLCNTWEALDSNGILQRATVGIKLAVVRRSRLVSRGLLTGGQLAAKQTRTLGDLAEMNTDSSFLPPPGQLFIFFHFHPLCLPICESSSPCSFGSKRPRLQRNHKTLWQPPNCKTLCTVNMGQDKIGTLKVTLIHICIINTISFLPQYS